MKTFLVVLMVILVSVCAFSQKKVKEYKSFKTTADTVAAIVVRIDGQQIFPTPSVKDTVFVKWFEAEATLDSVVYVGSAGQFLKARLELVDSLYQTAGATLADTSTCTRANTIRSTACSGGTFTMPVGKILRMVYETVTTKPKQFVLVLCGL
jgi:hypothetical protein